MLRREGWKDNHKRVYRVYKEEGLNLRSKRPRRIKAFFSFPITPVQFTFQHLFNRSLLNCNIMAWASLLQYYLISELSSVQILVSLSYFP